MPEGIGCKVQSTPKFAAFESPQALRASIPTPQALRASIPTPFGPSGHFSPDRGNRPLEPKESLRGRTVRRGRCRSQPFATKERYGCGSAACRYTSARWEVTNLPEIPVKPVHSAGGQSRPPLRNGFSATHWRGERRCVFFVSSVAIWGRSG